MGKQAYKIKLPRKWKIYDVFHMSLLEQNSTREGWINNNNITTQLELDKSDNKEYGVEAICENKLYANKLKGYLPGLYYSVF